MSLFQIYFQFSFNIVHNPSSTELHEIFTASPFKLDHSVIRSFSDLIRCCKIHEISISNTRHMTKFIGLNIRAKTAVKCKQWICLFHQLCVKFDACAETPSWVKAKQIPNMYNNDYNVSLNLIYSEPVIHFHSFFTEHQVWFDPSNTSTAQNTVAHCILCKVFRQLGNVFWGVAHTVSV